MTFPICIQGLLNTNIHKPVKTVYDFLEKKGEYNCTVFLQLELVLIAFKIIYDLCIGGLALLRDERIEIATREILPDKGNFIKLRTHFNHSVLLTLKHFQPF